jgi:hypothetical protein
LSPAVRQTIDKGRIARAELAEYFRVGTSRGTTQRVAIDNANSSFCDGRYVDGAWTHTNPRCEDKVSYRTVSVPSGYLTVKIAPAGGESIKVTVATDSKQ